MRKLIWLFALSGVFMVSTLGASEGAVIADAIMFVPTNKLASGQSGTRSAAQQKANRELLAKLTANIAQFETEIEQLQSTAPERHVTMAVADAPEAGDIPLAIRGVVHQQGSIVPRGVLQVALNGSPPEIPEHESGRLQLAEWIASSENPLTARVMVNRIWHWLFGQGLVFSVDNFGTTGQLPSHPALLDYLAQEFVAQEWSIKSIVRRLMLSHVYQLSSSSDSSFPAGKQRH